MPAAMRASELSSWARVDERNGGRIYLSQSGRESEGEYAACNAGAVHLSGTDPELVNRDPPGNPALGHGVVGNGHQQPPSGVLGQTG